MGPRGCPAHLAAAASCSIPLLLLLLAATSTSARVTPPECNCSSLTLAPSLVCGENGMTFINRCVALCQGINVVKAGPCQQGRGAVDKDDSLPPADTAMFLGAGKTDATAVVGKAVLSRFAEQGLTYIARVKRSARKATLPRTSSGASPSARSKAGSPPSRPLRARITRDGDVYAAFVDTATSKQGTAAITSWPPSADLARAAGNSRTAAVPHASHNSTSRGSSRDKSSTIVGRDDRKEYDDHGYPWSMIGFVSSGCTGTIIGPKAVLTAGHCVYDAYYQEWMDAGYFYPNRHSGGNHYHGSTYYGYSTLNVDYIDTWFHHARPPSPGISTTKDTVYDFAVLTLVEEQTSYMGFGYAGSCQATTTYNIVNAGYPSDLPGQDGYGYRTYWQRGTLRFKGCTGRSTSGVVSTKLDSAGGQSGSPLFDGRNSVRAILCTGSATSTDVRSMNDWVTKLVSPIARPQR